ncbi:uncharacterized protein [Leptinotarsa decemlineata]|uniref:uncharacterized protein n=1 Tax=Leptinotarsa decemlineata TaxID=7539 RepID=UPI000C255960|nr:uncharacterized protein LOC111509170 [Leptinotarsa decemlineata]
MTASVKSFKDTFGSYPHAPTTSFLRSSYIQKDVPMVSSPIQLSATVPEAVRKMHVSQSSVLRSLRSVREPIISYQETRGVSRNEDITFLALLTSLCTHAYTAAITILVMLWNLAPLLDGFVYFARFFLDRLIQIFETQGQKEKIIRAAVFLGEILVILFLIFLIMGLIFMPVYVLAARIVSKIWGMIMW